MLYFVFTYVNVIGRFSLELFRFALKIVFDNKDIFDYSLKN